LLLEMPKCYLYQFNGTSRGFLCDHAEKSFVSELVSTLLTH